MKQEEKDKIIELLNRFTIEDNESSNVDNSLNSDVKNLSNPDVKNLSELTKLWDYNFSLGTNTTNNINDKIKLLYLTSFVIFKIKSKYPTLSDDEIFAKVFGSITDESYQPYLKSIYIISKDLIYGVDDVTVDATYKNLKDVITEIKKLIQQWIPF